MPTWLAGTQQPGLPCATGGAGYVGSQLLLRRLKDNLAIRPASINQSTIKALEERGLIENRNGVLRSNFKGCARVVFAEHERGAEQIPFPVDCKTQKVLTLRRC